MAEAYAVALRERVIHAYEAGDGSYPVIAARFALGEATVKRWVWRYRDAGQVDPEKKGGDAVADYRDRGRGLGDAAGRPDGRRDHRRLQPDAARPSPGPCIDHEAGPASVRVCREKKRRRPLEASRPDVQTKRRAFLTTVRRIPVKRLVFLDEAGVHLAMSRSHTWVNRGTEYIDPVPMNWGTTLTLLGAIRVTGWVVLRSLWATANAVRFVAWLTDSLLPRLRRGDVLVMDNLRAHHDRRVAAVCRARGVRVLYLPPYSPDLNPIEAGWALQKQHVRKIAPRSAHALRRVARRARYRVTPRHCRQWFAHAGYPAQLR